MPMPEFKWTPVAVIVILLAASVLAVVVNEIAPWATKNDLQATITLLKQSEAADIASLTARLSAHDRQLETINLKLESISESNGDIKQVLGQINQKLQDFTDPNLPYIPEHKKK